MRHPQYKDGVLIGHFANEQKTRAGKVYTSPPVADDHSDIVAWEQRRKQRGRRSVSLETRVAQLEALLAKLKV